MREKESERRKKAKEIQKKSEKVSCEEKQECPQKKTKKVSCEEKQECPQKKSEGKHECSKNNFLWEQEKCGELS